MTLGAVGLYLHCHASISASESENRKHINVIKNNITFISALVTVLGQNGSGQNGTDKIVWTKWYTDKMVLDKMVWTKWYG